MTHLARSLLLAAAVLGLSAPASAADNVELTVAAKKEVTVVDENGKEHRKLVEPTEVVPGDTIVYLLTYTNRGKKRAEDVVITDPIPDGTRYLAGSASGADTRIAFSVDGKRFAPEGKLKVRGKDGKERLADPGEYRFIRWKLTKPLAPGKSGQASFRVKIR